MDELESMKYVLMTDDGGDVYTNAVVSYMKKNIGYETVKNLYSQYSSLNENKSAGEYDDSKIDSALKALKDNAAHEGGGKSIARSSPPRAYSAPSSVSKAKQTSESKAESTEGGNAIENPLVKVQKVKASGILSQVLMRARCQETVLIHQPECPGEVCIKEQGAGPKVVMTGMRKYLCSSIF